MATIQTACIEELPEPMAAAVLVIPDAGGRGRLCDREVAQHGIPVARIELADEASIDVINRLYEPGLRVAPTRFLFHGGEAEVAEHAPADLEAGWSMPLRRATTTS